MIRGKGNGFSTLKVHVVHDFTLVLSLRASGLRERCHLGYGVLDGVGRPRRRASARSTKPRKNITLPSLVNDINSRIVPTRCRPVHSQLEILSNSHSRVTLSLHMLLQRRHQIKDSRRKIPTRVSLRITQSKSGDPDDVN